jgi:hypothetical protein
VQTLLPSNLEWFHISGLKSKVMKKKLSKKARETLINTRALESVHGLDLPKEILVSNDAFLPLGLTTGRSAYRVLGRLRERHGENLPSLIGIALREAWFALFRASGSIALGLEDNSFNDDDGRWRKVSSPESYRAKEGFAWTLYNGTGYLIETPQQASFRDGTAFQTRLSDEDILEAVGLYWLSEAATLLRRGDIEGCLDSLSEGHDAFLIVHGVQAWASGLEEEGKDIAKDSQSKARSDLGRSGAHAAHRENREMREEIFVWLDKNMSNFKSMEKAAEAIFNLKLQPIAYRTARDWVGAWKKLRSAGMA